MAAAPSGPPTDSPVHDPDLDNLVSLVADIPVEIVSDDEMALLETALALASSRASLSSSSSLLFQRNVRSISSLPKRRLSGCSVPDIEDSSDSVAKKSRAPPSLFHRFRKKKGLSVTDITATEWCEKQMEFVLLRRKKRTTKAMRAGSERHEKLEQEVVKKVKVRVKSTEDRWAMRFMNFIIGANQLLFDGLTRELPLIGFVQGAWMVGVIDEIQMPVSESERIPILVDTKTRVRNTLPAEPQRRNGRLQLMCYKYMWDDAVNDNFPTKKFFDFFNLNPYLLLSKEIRESAANSGFPAETLDEIVRYYRNTYTNCRGTIHCSVKTSSSTTMNWLRVRFGHVWSSGSEKGKPITLPMKSAGNADFVTLLQNVV
ncbi:hypothetical protein CRG98_017006 [Punica granatum]|uniref:Exonuclease V, chloroplastic n=1 Tax=Punica granatum TaxID=22663 RepID=A0A2I0K205_PUNGR|nr:hypothetical protein CRG98_017006 [Punica granatum]